jgi:hypothetical protein
VSDFPIFVRLTAPGEGGHPVLLDARYVVAVDTCEEGHTVMLMREPHCFPSHKFHVVEGVAEVEAAIEAVKP